MTHALWIILIGSTLTVYHYCLYPGKYTSYIMIRRTSIGTHYRVPHCWITHMINKHCGQQVSLITDKHYFMGYIVTLKWPPNNPVILGPRFAQYKCWMRCCLCRYIERVDSHYVVVKAFNKPHNVSGYRSSKRSYKFAQMLIAMRQETYAQDDEIGVKSMYSRLFFGSKANSFHDTVDIP